MHLLQTAGSRYLAQSSKPSLHGWRNVDNIRFRQEHTDSISSVEVSISQIPFNVHLHHTCSIRLHCEHSDLLDWIDFQDMVCSISTCILSLQQLYRYMRALKHAFVDQLSDSVYAYHVLPWTEDQQVVLCFRHLAQFLV